MMEKIDFVLTWVDGNDKEWLQLKKKYQHETDSSSQNYDFMDWGLLKYWFRGIEENTPWVNKVFFVTMGHVPKWLNLNHPKLVVVNHKEFIPEKYLPTFSSHTIELNLHRINDLSENFVYFNDDMYVINEMKPTDFFKKKLPCDSGIMKVITPKNDNCIASLQLKNISLINKNFDKNKIIFSNPSNWFNYKYGKLNLLNLFLMIFPKFCGIYELHLPSSFKKSIFYEFWSVENEICDKTCLRKFRDFNLDINQWAVKEWQLAKNLFYPRTPSIGKTFIVDDINSAKTVEEFILKKKGKIICVNDHIVNNELKQIIEIVDDSFSRILPKKSNFEL